ncbi:MAG: hypothetical protein GFH27_549311n166 [Chloroflexi bacterium AL-W]|nr:hypothetical protein [Chloroflexi bacterium AL-N1]NOK68656.1 hypothetical protein [Chloroflexi bacterium AL-N10]NOK76142.1 hypothetical protein [Chloroflexi bacterium AL-N5]NOK84221.1 hypothetical protein [Chloroflexi bacterium AL-W]NOK91280.1 hypothetical protein [Chloroflexi bacterium AL-N15]
MTTLYGHTKLPSERTVSQKPVLEQYESDDLPSEQGYLQRRPKHYTMSQYRRLVVLVVLVNLALLGFGLTSGGWWAGGDIALGTLANLVVGNIAVAILIRQQYVINFLFWIATSAPTSWPLSIRWVLGKVYHFGGIHSGCAGAATIWFAVLVGSMTSQLANGLSGISVGTVVVTYALLALLIGIVVMALPPLRSRYHNNFELTHRFGGWAALLLFYVQTIMFINDQRGDIGLGSALLTSFGFWMLIILTISIVLPWLRLRKVPVKIETPSNHVALVRFNHGVTPFAGSSTTVSRNPLVEWHSFANVPTPGEDGFRLTISRAGDWTGEFIDDVPSHVWVKGIPTAGVGNIDKLFKRVVWVATGSGIGPCLPHLLAQEVPAHLVWSTRNPRKTYGDKLVDEILSVQPNATIWDTTEQGKPDMVKLAYAAYKSFNAEAVIVISNQKLTREVVYGMESRGIPAYGAIWDS